ncbi:MAG TPA: LptF/LptG family permease [Myxococcota bacterium]|nr:LptF/LptG family permease [Myxococcota bacterium]
MTAFRYVLGVFLRRAALCLAAGLALYAAADAVESGKALARLGVSAGAAFWMSALMLPRAAMQLLPAAALLGAFLTAGALRRRGEVEALRALGRGPWMLAAPIAAGAALCGMLALALSETAVPAAVAALDASRAAAGWYGPARATDAFARDAGGAVWLARGVSADGRSAATATGMELGPDGAPAWRTDLTSLRWDGAVWRYAAGARRALGPIAARPTGAGPAAVTDAADGRAPDDGDRGGGDAAGGAALLHAGTIALVPPEALLPAPREADAVEAVALWRRTALLAAQGRRAPRLEVDLWGRLALLPLALAGALAAVPFAFGGGGRRGAGRPAAQGAGAALGAALAAALLLWLLVSTGRALGAAGALAPTAAALAPPLAALVVILWRVACSGHRP